VKVLAIMGDCYRNYLIIAVDAKIGMHLQLGLHPDLG